MKLLIEQFDSLCEKAEAAFNEELDVSYESTLLDILNFVKNHPDNRAEFVAEFKKILMSRDSPFEAAAFCMRELQWPEILHYAVQKMSASRDPRSEALRSLVTAYDQDWPDADLYEYYSKHGSS